MSPRHKKSAALVPYMRKSSGEDPEGSRYRQRSSILAWAALNNVELADEVWEPGVSGNKPWRERGLGAAIAAVERGEAAGIICEEQSRLSRANGLQTAEVWDALNRAGARLVITADGLDTDAGDQELNFAIRAALAREQWKQYARRMAAARRRAVMEKGIPINHVIAFGYRQREDRKIEPDPETAPLVRQLFERRVAGEGWGALAQWLGEQTGRTWTRQGISNIVRNRVYLGELKSGDYVNPGSHEPLVDAPLFMAASHREPNRSGAKPSERWLLAGMVRCAECGKAMSVWTGPSRSRDPRRGNTWQPRKASRRYKCPNNNCRPQVTVDAPSLERLAVLQAFALSDEVETRQAETRADLTTLEEAAALTQRRLEQALAPEAQDALAEHWASTVKERRGEHEEALAKLGEALAQPDAPEARSYRLREAWGDLSHADRRASLALFWREIRISRRDGKKQAIKFITRGPGGEAEVELRKSA